MAHPVRPNNDDSLAGSDDAGMAEITAWVERSF
jgi:hypothetical protein